MPPPIAPGAHDADIDHGEIAANIAADDMAAQIAAEADQEMERAEPTPESLSAEPSDFDELCMKVIKAGDMTSVIDDKVRDEVRFEVAVALVYAKVNPHIIGGGRPRAHDSKTTVQALWRQTAVQCGFSEQEKPDPQGSKLNKVTKYAKTILTKKWEKIEKPDPKAWRAKEFMCHIQALENLIDGFNPNAYTPEVVLVLRRLAKKCHDATERAADSREAQALLQSEDAAGATSAVTHAMAAVEVARAHARSSDPRSQGKRQCLEATECAGASEPSSSAMVGAMVGAMAGASSYSLDAMVGASPIDGASLTPASPPVPPGSLVPAMPLVPAEPLVTALVTAGTGHPWRLQQAQLAQQAQQAHQADAAVLDVADHLFVDGLWSEDAGSPSPIGGVEWSYRGAGHSHGNLEDELDDESGGDDEIDETGGGSLSGGSLRSLMIDDSEEDDQGGRGGQGGEGGFGPAFRSLSLAASALDDLSPLKTALKEILK
jgi:hypothetical protein